VREKRNAYGVLVGTHKGKDYFEVLGIDGRLQFKWTIKTWNGRCGPDRYQWRAVVNTVMNLRLPDKRLKPGNLPTASGGTVFTFYRQSVESYKSYNSCNSIYSTNSATTIPVTLCHFILCEPQEFPRTSPAQKVPLSSQV